MFLRKDEREQAVNRVVIRYTWFFESILISGLWMAIILNKLILIQSIHLFNSIFISFSINLYIPILASTQMMVMLVAQAIINKHSGGTNTPIVSGNNKFRFMDERERVVSDKAAFIVLIYTNVFLIILTIIDILFRGILGIPLIIIILEVIFYKIVKRLILNHYGEDIS